MSPLFTQNIKTLTQGLQLGYRIELKNGKFTSVKDSLFRKKPVGTSQETLNKVKIYLESNRDILLNENSLKNSLGFSIEKRIDRLRGRLKGFFSFFLFWSTKCKIEESIKNLTALQAAMKFSKVSAESNFIRSLSPNTLNEKFAKNGVSTPGTPYKESKKSGKSIRQRRTSSSPTKFGTYPKPFRISFSDPL